MKPSPKYERFKLWQMFPDGVGHLYDSLRFIFINAADYLGLKKPVAFIVPHKMSFYEALRSYSKNVGLKLLPVGYSYERLAIMVPIVARDKNSDRPVLLLPSNEKYYLKIDETSKAELISIANIPVRFDEQVQLFPINIAKDSVAHGTAAKVVASFLPGWALFAMSLMALLFGVLFLFMAFASLDDVLKDQRLAFFLSTFVTAIFLVLVISHSRWLSIRNYGLSVVYLLYDFYRHIVLKACEKSPFILTRQSFAIEHSCTDYFLHRFNIIFSLSAMLTLLVFALVFNLSLAIGYGVFLAVVFVIAFMIRRQKQQRQSLRLACEDDVRLCLEQYGLSLPALIGLHAWAPLINNMTIKIDRLMKEAIRLFSLSYITHTMRLILPMLGVLLFAFWLSYEEEIVLAPWHIAPMLVMVITIGLLLAYLCERSQEKTLDMWPLEKTHSHVQPVNVHGHIELIDVSFSYEDNGALVIKNSNCRVKAEKLYVIYGQSGFGKSTLLKLLMGLFTPHSGQVIIDGQDIRSLDRNSLRKYFGVVSEDSMLFAGSVFDNIMCGRDLPSKLLERLLLSHEIFDTLIDLPMGLETYIFWHAKNISHMERTLILLARALVHQPKVLFMDELLNGLESCQQINVLNYLSTLKMTRILTSPTKLPEAYLDGIIDIHDQSITEITPALL